MVGTVRLRRLINLARRLPGDAHFWRALGIGDAAAWDKQTDLLAVSVELLDIIARKGVKKARRPLVKITRPYVPKTGARGGPMTYDSPAWAKLVGSPKTKIRYTPKTATRGTWKIRRPDLTLGRGPVLTADPRAEEPKPDEPGPSA